LAKLMTRYCARIVLFGALAIMLFPRHDIDGLELDSRAVEGGAFGLYVILLILVRAERLRRLRHLSPGTLVACLPGAAVELIAIAGVLEAGQSLVHRNASASHFLANAVVITAVAAVCAALAAFLALPSRRDLARRMSGD
jgi:hypothetical protein